jgi:hypothetical protein
MGLKGFIKRLERGARGNHESFVLMDGSTYYFSPGSGELFLHTAECIRADYAGRRRPDPPPTLLALCKARDRRAAAEKVATSGMFPYDLEALVERGELVPRTMVASTPEGRPG